MSVEGKFLKKARGTVTARATVINGGEKDATKHRANVEVFDASQDIVCTATIVWNVSPLERKET